MKVDEKVAPSEPSEALPFLENPEKCKNSSDVSEEEDVSGETACGFWVFKGPFMQRFATEKMYVILYGIAGCVMTMTFAYFNGTITTLEKRYKIPTKISGIISVGNDISTMLTAALLGYYAENRHRPRWMGIGLLTIVAFCLLTSSLHFIYGAGEDALKLTREYGQVNETLAKQERDKKLCQTSATGCIQEEIGQWVPQVFLFVAQLISGVGQALFYTLGIAYLDDNGTKSKTPAMLSLSTFLRMLGPAIGYSLAALCLRLYIEPTLEPLIGRQDPRWLGAWWLGWIVLAAMTLVSAIFLFMFPRELPSSRRRRLQAWQVKDKQEVNLRERSFADMMQTVRKLMKNKVYVYNTFASILYFFGYMAYWIFTPKYIETQYRQSAAMATMATGTVALGFSAAGVLISGYVISKYRPSARAMASWNAIVDFVTVAGILCYVAIGCESSDRMNSLSTLSLATDNSCSASCHCDYVHYAPVCSPENITYISACHAGCSERTKDVLGRTIYTGCKCLGPSSLYSGPESQYAVDGSCPVDCFNQFLVFLGVMCFLKLVGASSKSTNLLLALRCMPPEDKTFALGLGSMVASLLGFIPSPIFFGWLIDKYCLVWGKTCSNKGNCWLYDTEPLRYALNLTAASFIFVGGFLNIAVWYYAKDLKIFDEAEPTGAQDVEMKKVDKKSIEDK